jgi:CheY-specific phosphatase CheX
MRETMTMNMKQAISNVLELMFFLPVQFIENDCPMSEWLPQDQVYTGATLGFSGPVSGSYYLLIPVAMAKEITANFLGLSEEEVNEAQERDTVKEALNMIGGHMLSLVDKPDGYQLAIPQIISETGFDMNTNVGKKENIIFIEAEGSHLAAGIVLD